MTVTWDDVNEKSNELLMKRGEWAGAPALADTDLVLEPRHPLYENLNGCSIENLTKKKEPDAPVDYKLVNSWFSFKRDSQVYIFREANGRTTHSEIKNAGIRMRHLMHTLGNSQYIKVDAELKAIQTLMPLINRNQFRTYMVSGMFVESSKRSGVAYVFRKNRPTLAIRGNTYIAALCLHPIGYYDTSWLGVMAPTDDVIAHLLMMRANEHKFWAKANQHAVWVPQSGV